MNVLEGGEPRRMVDIGQQNASKEMMQCIYIYYIKPRFDGIHQSFMIKSGDVFTISGWWEHFAHILGIATPSDELIFFRGVDTTNQLFY